MFRLFNEISIDRCDGCCPICVAYVRSDGNVLSTSDKVFNVKLYFIVDVRVTIRRYISQVSDWRRQLKNK